MSTRPRPAAASGLRRGPPEDLCLAFANTLFWRGTDEPTETLLAPADLLRWCADAGGLDRVDCDAMAARWRTNPAAAAAALGRAVALREALYRVFSDIAGGAAGADADIATINRELGDAAGRANLLCGPDGWAWTIPAQTSDPGLLLAPVLWSAGDLLAGRRLARVRRCANERCLWLFLDDSKAATRRWCAMSACGNRAKAHRHYAKLRATR